MKTYRVGTRKSRLAQWQADQVIACLKKAHPQYQFEKVFIQTAGDRDQKTDLRQMSGQGVFVKQIQVALLAGEIDFAVHSAKDMPSVEAEDLCLAAVPLQGSRRDVLISQQAVNKVEDLPQGACIGTSSLRRQFALQYVRPDLQCKALRGNIETRLQRLQEGKYAAIMMAEAAIQRLALSLEDLGLFTCPLAEQLPFLPAVGQGMVAVECVKASPAALLAQAIDQKASHQCLEAERAFLAVFGVGCNVPLAARASLEGKEIRLQAYLGQEGRQILFYEEAKGSEPESLGTAVGLKLKQKGAQHGCFITNTNR